MLAATSCKRGQGAHKVPAVPSTEPMAREERSRMSESGKSTRPESRTIHVLLEQSHTGAFANIAIDLNESPRMMAYESPPTYVLKRTVRPGMMAVRSPKTLIHAS